MGLINESVFDTDLIFSLPHATGITDVGFTSYTPPGAALDKQTQPDKIIKAAHCALQTRRQCSWPKLGLESDMLVKVSFRPRPSIFLYNQLLVRRISNDNFTLNPLALSARCPFLENRLVSKRMGRRPYLTRQKPSDW